MTEGPKPTLRVLRFRVSLIVVVYFGSSRLVGFRFFKFLGFSKFLLKFRFAFCLPLVTADVLFVPVNSFVGPLSPVCVQTLCWSMQSKIGKP